jgi:hypothetical protein
MYAKGHEEYRRAADERRTPRAVGSAKADLTPIAVRPAWTVIHGFFFVTFVIFTYCGRCGSGFKSRRDQPCVGIPHPKLSNADNGGFPLP